MQVYTKNKFKSQSEIARDNYLLTNKYGGYSALTLAGSMARIDHGLLIACYQKNPTLRYSLIGSITEELKIKDKVYSLSAQDYVLKTKCNHGYKYLNYVQVDTNVVFEYQLEGIIITKEINFRYDENQVNVDYQIDNLLGYEYELVVTPNYTFAKKGESTEHEEIIHKPNMITVNEQNLYYVNEGTKVHSELTREADNYYQIDAENGRIPIGNTYQIHSFVTTEKNLNLKFGTISDLITTDEIKMVNERRKANLIKQVAPQDQLTTDLLLATDKYIIERENYKTSIAGYPFFADWGRDTMISMFGATIVTGRNADTKSIFTTFEMYLQKGLMPNMFPEQGEDPLYNTVDASLLYIWALQLYLAQTDDMDYVKEKLPIIKSIIDNYQAGTDYQIYIDKTDGLLHAGYGEYQLTWMDVNYQGILPTPRHGKPVEINAMWYNAIMFYLELLSVDGETDQFYEKLSHLIYKNFNEQFYLKDKGYLKDVVSGKAYDLQVRPNQVWALDVPYSPVKPEYQKSILNVVKAKLLTPFGLRSLSFDDKEFIGEYGGSHQNRDMAYHQGTVWPFPMGGYLSSFLKVNKFSASSVQEVTKILNGLEPILTEGCSGQLAEIYDGLVPNESRGCFAQCWSVSEMLRVKLMLQNQTKFTT